MNPEPCQQSLLLHLSFHPFLVTSPCSTLSLTTYLEESSLTKQWVFSIVSGEVGWVMRKRPCGTSLRRSITIWLTIFQNPSAHHMTPPQSPQSHNETFAVTFIPLGGLVPTLPLTTFLLAMPPWNSREQRVPTHCKSVLECLDELLLKNKPERWSIQSGRGDKNAHASLEKWNIFFSSSWKTWTSDCIIAFKCCTEQT